MVKAVVPSCNAITAQTKLIQELKKTKLSRHILDLAEESLNCMKQSVKCINMSASNNIKKRKLDTTGSVMDMKGNKIMKKFAHQEKGSSEQFLFNEEAMKEMKPLLKIAKTPYRADSKNYSGQSKFPTGSHQGNGNSNSGYSGAYKGRRGLGSRNQRNNYNNRSNNNSNGGRNRGNNNSNTNRNNNQKSSSRHQGSNNRRTRS